MKLLCIAVASLGLTGCNLLKPAIKTQLAKPKGIEASITLLRW